MKDQKAILSFWRDIEIFNLPDLPKGTKMFAQGSVLPWQVPHTPEKDRKWLHVVFFGRIAKKDVTEAIEEAIAYTTEEDWVEKVNGFTNMAAMLVDEHGHVSQDNGYIQAAYIYGLKCLQKKRTLSSIDESLEQAQELFRERFPLDQQAEDLDKMQDQVINWNHLNKECEVLNALKIKGLTAGKDVFIRSVKVSRLAKQDIAFLNSFYLKDLNNLIDGKGKWGEGLNKMLSLQIADTERLDLLNDVSAFWRVIDPKLIPAGRWPSNPKWGLYSAQLGAVNTCLDQLKNKNGIIGVNGPPGTGKTTLLSDIIADIIVTRATKLLKNKTGALFGKGERIDRQDRFFYAYPVISDVFEDAGIVVASNNNTAVENISKELPSAEKIDLDSFPEADYFAELATELIEGESWGVLAAALGNSENKTAFKNKFWYASENRKGFSKLLTDTYDKDNDQTDHYLKRCAETRSELKQLLQEFETFKHDASYFHSLLPEFFNDLHSYNEEEEKLDRLSSGTDTSAEERPKLEERIRMIKSKISSLQEGIIIHSKDEPVSFFGKIFKKNLYRQWEETNEVYYSKLNEEEAKLRKVREDLEDLLDGPLNLKRRIANANKKLNKINARLAAYQQVKEELQKKYDIPSENIPDELYFRNYADDKESFHKASPWSCAKINTLRSKIFLLSLKLHEYTILSNAKSFKNNLTLFMDVLDGKVKIEAKLAESLWKTFFFCIPVVSTTLASVARLFVDLRKESIGWLLIDEAGQATPLSATGLINRAQKSIIIGDPLQIEPVVTINHKLIKVLAEKNNVDAIWSPLHNSTQGLADRVTNTGAKMTDSEHNEIWSGFPLRTHRRCNNPMFDIANTIAYGNQMVKAQPDADFECKLGNSCWFDVHGESVEDKHVIIEEIELLKEKIARLGIDQDVFVISPFKSVADKCTDTFRHNHHIKCGTIHTFQGKEADIVFLILGSDPAKPGARDWASKKPNMLNVALTRAKKRFYVIGSKKTWKSFNYFNVLAKRL